MDTAKLSAQNTNISKEWGKLKAKLDAYSIASLVNGKKITDPGYINTAEHVRDLYAERKILMTMLTDATYICGLYQDYAEELRRLLEASKEG